MQRYFLANHIILQMYYPGQGNCLNRGEKQKVRGKAEGKG